MNPGQSNRIAQRLSPVLTLERRAATAHWNQEERERIIAMKAFELFCLRGGGHGSDLDDWLNAERELSLAEGEIVLEHSEDATDLSILAARAERGQIMLSLSPDSVLIIWTSTQIDEEEIRNLSVGLVPLPRHVDPEGAAVEYAEGRLHVHLPHRDGRAIPKLSASPNARKV